MNALLSKLKKIRNKQLQQSRLKKYLSNRIPWAAGYDDYKWIKISEYINNEALILDFKKGTTLPAEFGQGLDERIVEYPFLFSRLASSKSRVLDAGSTFNFSVIVNHPVIAEKELTIFTAYPEAWSFTGKKISYQYGDLRNLPFRDNWFDEVFCISTLEHVGMDNSIYGYTESKSVTKDLPEYIKAVLELCRVLKSNGRLVITFPFGKKINYGYFQQFNSDMVREILDVLTLSGSIGTTFFQYVDGGWNLSNEQRCKEAEAYNPHTGQGKGNDGAAHSRAICCLEYTKR